MKISQWCPNSWRGDKKILSVVFNLERPIFWVGACATEGRSRDFCQNFESENIVALNSFQDRGGDMLFVLTGISSRTPHQKVAMIARTHADLLTDDEVLGIRELSPSAMTQLLPSEETDMAKTFLPQKKFSWWEIVKSIFRISSIKK